MDRIYAAIDLKSFYASVECIERGLDPLTTNLVVADESRTEKTICLAVTPTLKRYGISGRARLFEVVQRVREVNALRRRHAPGGKLSGSSYHDPAVQASPLLALDYLVAPPQMARYIEISTKIYHVYLSFIAPEDIHVYSIDEVFLDLTNYLDTYRLTPQQLVRNIILQVQKTTGIFATAGIGTNLYLAKVAMDIWSKHVDADEYGVCIAFLDEEIYRRTLWTHRPLTDFWRVGRGYAKKLEAHRLYTMGDIARCSVGKTTEYYNEAFLYKLFGVNAELLIDHAWGWESCTIADIKAYKPSSNSIGTGQVLQNPYSFEDARLVIREMADALSLDLVEKGLVTNQIVLTIGYDIENLSTDARKAQYHGAVTRDYYGRAMPKHAHGTVNLQHYTASTKILLSEVTRLFEDIVDENLLVRRMYIVANHVIEEAAAKKEYTLDQLDLFTDAQAIQEEKAREDAMLQREKKRQEAILTIKQKYGKNAIVKGMNLQQGATAIQRNNQIGGHRK